MLVLVVGGTGFLGSNLARIAGERACYVVRREPLARKPLVASVLREYSVRVIEVDDVLMAPRECLGEDKALVYMAGVLTKDPSLLYHVHVELPVKLLERYRPRVFVYVSAASVSPPGCEEERHLEHADWGRLDLYTLSKAEGERRVTEAARGLGVGLAIIRPVLMVGLYWSHPEARLATLAARGIVVDADIPYVDAFDVARLIVELVDERPRLVWLNAVASRLGVLLATVCRRLRRWCLRLPLPGLVLRIGSAASLRARLAYRLARLQPRACIASRMGFRFSSIDESAGRLVEWLSALAPRHGGRLRTPRIV